jgi:hypothetical protein
LGWFFYKKGRSKVKWTIIKVLLQFNSRPFFYAFAPCFFFKEMHPFFSRGALPVPLRVEKFGDLTITTYVDIPNSKQRKEERAKASHNAALHYLGGTNLIDSTLLLNGHYKPSRRPGFRMPLPRNSLVKLMGGGRWPMAQLFLKDEHGNMFYTELHAPNCVVAYKRRQLMLTEYTEPPPETFDFRAFDKANAQRPAKTRGYQWSFKPNEELVIYLRRREQDPESPSQVLQLPDGLCKPDQSVPAQVWAIKQHPTQPVLCVLLGPVGRYGDDKYAILTYDAATLTLLDFFVHENTGCSEDHLHRRKKLLIGNDGTLFMVSTNFSKEIHVESWKPKSAEQPHQYERAAIGTLKPQAQPCKLALAPDGCFVALTSTWGSSGVPYKLYLEWFL